MPKIDIPIKRLMQARPGDWIEYLLPEYAKARFSEVQPDRVPKAESRLDALWQIGTGEDSFYLHLEPQGYLDPALPARMLRYRADVWEYTMMRGLGTPSIRQAVIFFYPEHDNGINFLTDSWGEEKSLSYGFRAVRVWEMEKERVLEKELIGLFPLLPLMKEKPGETPEQVLETAVRAIEAVEDAPLKADLLATVSILAGKRYAPALIRKFIRREMLMESQLLKEWTEEERREAAEKAAKEATLSIILDQLEEKFDLIPKRIKDQLSAIQDLETLRYLTKKIIKAATLEEFEKFLEKAKQELS
jgi:predicted transposase YdaD